MGAHSRVARPGTTVRRMRRIAGGGALGVVALGSVVGGAGVAQAEQTVGTGGVSVTVPDSCDIYLDSGLDESFPDSSHTRRCLAEKGLTGSDPSTGSSTSSSTTSSGGTSTTTTTTTGDAPAATPAPSSTPAATPASSPTPAPAVTTRSGSPSTDPDDDPAAPGETKSVPIG